MIADGTQAVLKHLQYFIDRYIVVHIFTLLLQVVCAIRKPQKEGKGIKVGPCLLFSRSQSQN